MSRTDAHRPTRVHLAEAPVAYHDHTHGPCDLPDLDDVVRSGLRFPSLNTRCSWFLTRAYQHDHSPFSKYKGDRRNHRKDKAGGKRRHIADQLYS